MNIKVLIPLLGILIISCKSNNSITDNIEGIYSYEGDINEKLIFKNSSFLYINKNYDDRHLPLFKCCDTISFGTFQYLKEDKLLKLTSSSYYNNTPLDIEVTEEIDEKNKDSVLFVFNNPIEHHYKNYNESYREIFYEIEIFKDDIKHSLSDVNPVKIKIDNNVKEFQITVYPKYDLPVKELGVRKAKTILYKVEKKGANIFSINIPKLDYNFFMHRRLKGDYLKMKNKNKLIWNEKIFIQ